MIFQGRALHFVFKVGNRTKNIEFFKQILGMQVLRHEEFKEGCEAQCNGPYDGRWSKTMIGYGVEDTHFVMELTYNYNVPSYELGNDFLGIVIRSKKVMENAKKYKWPIHLEGQHSILRSPDGYPFHIIDELQPTNKDPVEKVILASSDLTKTELYWHNTLSLKIIEKKEKKISFAFDQSSTNIEFQSIGTAVDHKTAFGRIAFSIPTEQLTLVNDTIKKSNYTILTPLVSLETPGKATVTVIILADPDGHEICFVGDEGFRELSKFDPEGTMLLNRYIKKDEERKK